jgi:hypothetical protein
MNSRSLQQRKDALGLDLFGFLAVLIVAGRDWRTFVWPART